MTTYDYTYDPAGRLWTITTTPDGESPTTHTYEYDANGNRTLVDGQTVGSYDDQDRLTSYQGTSYTYTAAGDLESKTDASGTTQYSYDPLGNLRTVALPDGRTLDYVIDGQNRRVGKKVDGALVQGFLYGDQLRIVAELDGSSQPVSRFVYATRPNVPDFMVKGGTTYRILSDQVGSVRLVVNASTGAVAQRIDYDAFGNPTYVTGAPDFQPFGFAGGLADPDTGLVRFGARDYDPRVGRWTSKDPIGFGGGDANLYGYVVGDPVNLIDPSGEILPLALALAVAATALVGATAVAVGGVEGALYLAARFGCDGSDADSARRARDEAIGLNLSLAAGLATAGVAAELTPVLGRAAFNNLEQIPALPQVATDVLVPGPPSTPAGAAINLLQEAADRIDEAFRDSSR